MTTVYHESRIETMVTETCCNCGVLFAMTQEYMDNRREDHKGFYCPNGHSLVYNGKSQAEKLKEQLESERRLTDNLRAARQAAEEQARHERTERKKLNTRLYNLKTRVKNGVCPCCNRQFPALLAHIRQEHPGYVMED